jgi:hypothetical protein
MDNMEIQKQAFHHTPRGIRDTGCPQLRWEAEVGRGRLHMPRCEETE